MALRVVEHRSNWVKLQLKLLTAWRQLAESQWFRSLRQRQIHFGCSVLCGRFGSLKTGPLNEHWACARCERPTANQPASCECAGRYQRRRGLGRRDGTKSPPALGANG